MFAWLRRTRRIARLYALKAGMYLICAAALLMTPEFFLAPAYLVFTVICALLAHSHTACMNSATEAHDPVQTDGS